MSSTWVGPTAEEAKGQRRLRVSNSMAKAVVDFVPKGGSNVITWYSCGPTVYDASHMGHARTYLCIDILQRVLEQYFGYSVLSVMNITDIEDKIILRARTNRLASEYLSAHRDREQDHPQIFKDIEEALATKLAAVQKKISTVEADAQNPEEAKAFRDQLESNARAVREAQETVRKTAGSSRALGEVLEKNRTAWDAMGEMLDGRRARDGVEMEGMMKTCQEHAARYEREFFEDMERLGVRQPQVLTRVSEYVDKIVSFIQKIIDNKMAYEANGSVYFDTGAFAAHPDHTYGRMRSLNTTETGEEDPEPGRKTRKDFALWKKSKSGEPEWPSPWGPGRPGWHIECSTMASDVLGAGLDVHFGGQDLAFPHHENELAQSEAFHGCKQWVRYFLHSGFLNINGLKMSKSLKNFITIREALASGTTSRQLRLMTLMTPWDRTMNYSNEVMKVVRGTEDTISEFCHVSATVARKAASAPKASWAARDAELCTCLTQTQESVHERLCDNFDTSAVMTALRKLISHTNEFVASHSAHLTSSDAMVVSMISRYVARILGIFGLEGWSSLDSGSSPSGAQATSAAAAPSIEAAVGPMLDVWCGFRTAVRKRAMQLKDQELLKLSDSLRDSEMPRLGVRLEDDGLCPWKLTTPEEAMRLVSEKQAREKEAWLAKAQQKVKLMDAEIARWDLWRVEPEAVPTTNPDGTPVPQKKVEKLVKARESAMKNHTKYLDALSANPNFLSELRQKKSDLDSEISRRK